MVGVYVGSKFHFSAAVVASAVVALPNLEAHFYAVLALGVEATGANDFFKKRLCAGNVNSIRSVLEVCNAAQQVGPVVADEFIYYLRGVHLFSFSCLRLAYVYEYIPSDLKCKLNLQINYTLNYNIPILLHNCFKLNLQAGTLFSIEQ